MLRLEELSWENITQVRFLKAILKARVCDHGILSLPRAKLQNLPD